MAKKTATADDKVQQLIALVQAKKAAISKAEKPSWQTNCSFAYEPGSNTRINVQVESNVENLVNMFAFVMAKQRAFDEAANILGVQTRFKWMGYTMQEWMADIQTRINKIQISKNKAELEALESRLDKLISPELRRELELAAIEKELAGG